VTVAAPPCPTCGRAPQDWRDAGTRIVDANGTKVRLQSDDHLENYRRWRYTLGGGLVATDIDQVEWRKGAPVAIIELTRVENVDPLPPAAYFEAILGRRERDGENRRADVVARALGVPAFLVCFGASLEDFWAIRISPAVGRWSNRTNQAGYAAWLRSLTP
jgi:hypothetical protein